MVGCAVRNAGDPGAGGRPEKLGGDPGLGGGITSIDADQVWRVILNSPAGEKFMPAQFSGIVFPRNVESSIGS